MVERDGSGWSLAWVSEGKVPRDFSDPSLSAVVHKATSEIAALYSGKREAAGAELQFAIYPWKGDAGKVILDLSRDGSRLTARDIQGTGITFQSESIDAVPADAERYLPNPYEAMLRWILPIARF